MPNPLSRTAVLRGAAFAAVLVSAALGPTSAEAVPTLTFQGLGQGQVTYDGAGGSLVGSNIGLDELVAFETGNGGANDGTFTCDSCVLNFTTGANISEASGENTSWVFEPGQNTGFTITGAVPLAGITDTNTTLLTGSFTSNITATVGEELLSIAISGLGTDRKDATLTSFFGLPADGWEFANTEIVAGGGNLDVSTWAFNSPVDTADVTNRRLVAVPEPGTLGLLGVGLVGLGLLARRRMTATRDNG